MALRKSSIIIASIGWLMNAPYWVYHILHYHDVIEHLSGETYLSVMVIGTIPIFTVLGYLWDKQVQLGRGVSLRSDILHALLENMEDGFIVYDKSRRIIEASDRAAEIFGAPKEELIGRRCTDLVKCSIEQCPVLDVFKRKESVFGEVCEQRRLRVGRKKFVKISSYPVRSNGDVEYVAEVIKDVTESALKEKEKETLSAIKEMPAGVKKEVVFKKITAALAEDFDYEASAIGVLKEEDKKIALVSCSANRQIRELAETMSMEYLGGPESCEALIIEEGLLEKVLKEKKPLVTENVHKLVMDQISDGNIKRLVSMLIKDAALKYCLLVPIVAGNKAVGIICVASAEELGENDAIRLVNFSRIAGKWL
ncbi:MAG: PAS domain S-box protein [Euryarchaeota archaeon]|nr:PAS domain S-box protein [Euryarchaeota archaeon]